MQKSHISSLSLNFNSTFTKVEHQFINYLIDTESKKTRTHHKLSSLHKNFFLDTEKLIKLLIKLQKKHIIIRQNPREIYLSLISFFEIDSSYIKIDLNEKLKEYINKNSFDIKTAFLLNNINSSKFYYDYCYGINTISEINFSIDDLKAYFQVESYDRFYDFERFVLKDICEDINKNSIYNVVYDKIKIGENKNNKIIGIKITVTSNSYSQHALKIFELLEKYPYYKNKDQAFLIIFDSLKYHPLTIVKEALEHMKTNAFIEEVYLKELELLLEENSNFVLLKSLDGIFPNILKLQSFLFQELKKINEISELHDELITNTFLKKLYLLSSGETLNFKVKNIRLDICYSKNELTKIDIYKKQPIFNS